MAGAGGGGPCGSNYDVFISFRGPDTRQGIVDCLYEHMKLCGIRVFVDKERIYAGEKVKEELMDAICDSKICMPVFSMLQANDDVKLKTSKYSNHLEELKKEHGSHKVDRWRKCLKDACKMQGWNLAEYTGQGKLIRITQEVLFKTRKRNMSLSNPIVGIEGPVKEIKELLDGHIDRVRFVIIHGMGGIGKTTRAKVIFNEEAPHGDVRSVLMIGYESLEDNEKELFLDIACYFHGMIKRLAMLVWESVKNLHPVNGLNTLLHKNLIEILDEDTI
ncbi:hypothetical protein MLD38_037595 [Melastoma candidum]|uniref:Uncharacterized protein n=1 Tax=Melastoma candidum TaxID=119954 RepID=A0ACB9LNC4_9MYRT|nr:hypothetical protein MLD38_037595 [Melastoma candidum]